MKKNYGFNSDGLVNREYNDSYDIKVSFKLWNNTRYYVTRDNKQIGWVSTDLNTTNGTTSTHTHYLNEMVNAIKNNN
jgi:hypothetical protein